MSNGFEAVSWRLILATGVDAKAEKILQCVSGLLEVEPTIVESKPYWKVANQFEVNMTTPLASEEPADAVFELLLQAQRLAPHWYVSGPHAYSDDRWSIDATVEKGFRLPGLAWVHATARNY